MIKLDAFALPKSIALFILNSIFSTINAVLPIFEKRLMQQEPDILSDVFVVKESSIVSFIIAGVFFALFLSGVFISSHKLDISLVMLSLIPAVLFTVNGIQRRKPLVIDCNGIYHYNELITDWNHFVQAYLDQSELLASYQDNFVLVLRYAKDGYEGCFKRTIPLTNTQDQSEEAILEAIRRFYALSQEQVLPLKQPLQISNQ